MKDNADKVYEVFFKIENYKNIFGKIKSYKESGEKEKINYYYKIITKNNDKK